MLRVLKNRRVLAIAAVVGILLAVALWPRATEVDVGAVSEGPLSVTVNDEGETRVRDRFEVTAPVAGEVLRIQLEPGDQVRAGQTLATLRPAAPTPLDERTRAEASASAAAAQAALNTANAERDRVRAVAERSQQELTRARALFKGGAISRDELDASETDARVARQSLSAADATVARARYDLQAARARLTQRASSSGARQVVVAAPVSGVVLRRYRESQSVVPAGEPLLAIGDPKQLEIVSDLLSAEAVKIKEGDTVLIEQWGGGQTLRGRVRLVEPSGFMKVSALGVEEQRVNVIIDFEDPAGAARALGDAYRVELRVVVWHQDPVLQVPIGSLFRRGDRWAVFVLEGGRARLRTVDVGQRDGTSAQVLSGLRNGEQVVLYPPDTLADGSRVTPRAG
jgi:HlyD family secretion protein